MRNKWQQELLDYLKYDDDPKVSPKEVKFLYDEILRLEKILGMVELEPVVPVDEHLLPIQQVRIALEDNQELQNRNRQWQQVLIGDDRRR